MAANLDERLQELTDRLEDGIKEIYASDKYAAYISAMSKFHRYSFGNALLILFQCPTATHVAGYRTWQELGRQVCKGETGIQILAPCQYTRYEQQIKRDPVSGAILYGADGMPLTETVGVSATRFKIASVFDISQTEGKELPSIGVDELKGDVADFDGIFKRLTEISPVPVEMEDIQGGAKGYMSPTEKRIAIQSGMSEVQTIRTLVHEIAHAKLHDPDTQTEKKERHEREIEAESVAYVVCQHFGIETSDYSFAYVAGWSKGKELSELKASLNRIHSTAGELINAISPPPVKQREQTVTRKKHYKRKGA